MLCGVRSRPARSTSKVGRDVFVSQKTWLWPGQVLRPTRTLAGAPQNEVDYVPSLGERNGEGARPCPARRCARSYRTILPPAASGRAHTQFLGYLLTASRGDTDGTWKC